MKVLTTYNLYNLEIANTHTFFVIGMRLEVILNNLIKRMI